MIFDVFLAGFTKEKPPVALTDSDLSELLAALKAGEMTDTIRSSLEWILQQLIEAEATAVIGAGPHERTETRTTQRNGHRPRVSARSGQSVRAQCAVGVGRLSAVKRVMIPIVAVALAAACAAAGRDDSSNVDVGRTPYFRPAPGWEAVQLGTSATAANVALGPYSSEGGFPGDTLERLREGEVVVWAMFTPMGEFPRQDEETPRRDLPLSLDDAQHGGFFEGQPGHIWADRILAQANGWNIDVWTFYGGDDPPADPAEPTAEARATAQEQLARLVVPSRA